MQGVSIQGRKLGILFCPAQRLKIGGKLNAPIELLLLGYFIQALPQSNFIPKTSC
jgi:hypothetical protein